ncbi:Cystathionine gamma-synthase [Aspergillus melleus]|uniref:Cystathionine gamma-synthase n=1 Tax=Aspergillus melleus TaxID=138277 RepID=A0ACC3AXP4_9EURO|nr:Cystathionine gamma-synthase [Aspergillus melleus]
MLVNIESLNPLPLTPSMGQPVPNVQHAISVQLPTWDDIKEMFTGAPRVKNAQLTGYPRSFIHEDVKQFNKACLDKFASHNHSCFFFPSLDYARACRCFATSVEIQGEAALPDDILFIRSLEIELEPAKVDASRAFITLHGVFCPKDRELLLHTFWRLVGVGISSRLAQTLNARMQTIRDVSGETARNEHSTVRGRWTERPHRKLCQRIACLLERAPRCTTRNELVARDDVYLYSTGMAAIYHAQEVLLRWRGSTSVVFGFPYELTLKLIETFGPGAKFFPFVNETDIKQLEEYLVQQSVAGTRVQAIWCECPSNPLLRTANLQRIRALADRFETAVVVDETVGGFANVDLLGVADMLVTSLTKSFSGSADVMAGSIVLNSSSRFYPDWKNDLETNYRNCLYGGDAQQLEENSRDLLMRTTHINNSAAYLAQYLQPLIHDPKSVITHVYHPKLDPQPENYRALMRQPTEEFIPGYGGLFTIQFEDVEQASVFFNALNVHKGPSLGAPVTLAQPYVQTVFHKQKAWAGECGLHESIVRVSVGLEDKHALLAAFQIALDAADNLKASRSQEVTSENGDHSGTNGVMESAGTTSENIPTKERITSEKVSQDTLGLRMLENMCNYPHVPYARIIALRPWGLGHRDTYAGPPSAKWALAEDGKYRPLPAAEVRSFVGRFQEEMPHGNPRTRIIRIVAALEGISLHLSTVVPRMYVNTDTYTSEFPLSRGKVPALKGPNVIITEVIAISTYLARIHNKANLLGDGSNEQAAEIMSWVSWANQEMLGTLASWFLPLIPNMKKPAPYNAQAVESGKVASNHLLGLLERTLESKVFLVGESLTLADLFVAMYLARGMEWILDAEWRASHPNIMKYFNGITSIDQWRAVIPQMRMIEKETPNQDPYAQQ